MYAQIKCPAEYAVTMMRTLDAPMTVMEGTTDSLRQMGQELFNPPNVKGWPGGKTWMNTMTLLATGSTSPAGSSTTWAARELFSDNLHATLAAHGVGAGGLGTPAQIVDAVWNTFLPGRVPPRPRPAPP